MRGEIKLIEHLNLIRKIVWSYVNSNPGLEFDDLFSEACIAYLEAIGDYDSTKSKISTFIWTVISNQLNNVIRSEYNRMSVEVVTDEIERNYKEFGTSPEYLFLAKEQVGEILEKMSPEAIAICNIILNENDVYLPVDKPKNCRGVIFKLLRDRGWSWGNIWKTFREIKEVVSVN